MALWDGILASQGAVSPEFSFRDIAAGRHVRDARVWIQAIKITGTAAREIGVQYCIPGDDGHKEWHQQANFDVPGAVGSEEMMARSDISPGILFRVRYNDNSTDQVRVLISSNSDPYAP